jgi:uncharacterized protein YodC (DUF2158 family)
MMADIVELKKDEPPDLFAIGDVVTLRSGGVEMTVRKLVRSKTIAMVTVDWMDAADTLCSADFDARQIKPADRDEE